MDIKIDIIFFPAWYWLNGSKRLPGGICYGHRKLICHDWSYSTINKDERTQPDFWLYITNLICTHHVSEHTQNTLKAEKRERTLFKHPVHFIHDLISFQMCFWGDDDSNESAFASRVINNWNIIKLSVLLHTAFSRSALAGNVSPQLDGKWPHNPYNNTKTQWDMLQHRIEPNRTKEA